jgi:hypothetical protein
MTETIYNAFAGMKAQPHRFDFIGLVITLKFKVLFMGKSRQKIFPVKMPTVIPYLLKQ